MNENIGKGKRGSWPDTAFGIFLIIVSAVALIETRNLKMGTTMDMGPGFMPRVLASILGVAGVVTVVKSAFKPHAKIERVKLRSLILVCASFAAFALLLPTFGVVVATVVLAKAADVNLAHIPVMGRKKKHGFSPESVSGVLGGFFAHQPAVLLLWRAGRYSGGCAAGHIAPEYGGHAATVYLRYGADLGPDHVGGYLLRRAVWRFDLGHSCQCAGRNFRSSHLLGWPSAGKAG